MAPWNGWLGGGSASDLPDSIPPRTGGADSAFVIFIDGALTRIYNEANGRAKEYQIIRESCKNVLDRLRGEGEGATPLVTPLDIETTAAVLKPLKQACMCNNAKLVELALGCLHKLVSHAYLHAESTPAGKLSDGSPVAQVVQMVSRCGDGGGEAVQLAVLRALLTIATADHFLVHGDCLMQTIRTAFNIAVSSESAEIQRTAKNSLLQMLNTIVRRVTLPPLSRLTSAASLGSVGSAHVDRAALIASLTDKLQETILEDPAEGDEGESREATAQEAQASETVSVRADPDDSAQPDSASPQDEAHASKESEGVVEGDIEKNVEEAENNGVNSSEEFELVERVSEDVEDEIGPPDIDLTSMKEEEAESDSKENNVFEESGLREIDGVESRDTKEELADLGDTRTAQLANLAEQADLRGLEKAMDQIEAERGQKTEDALQAEKEAQGMARTNSAERDRDVRRVIMREKRSSAWRGLSLNERDVLTSLSAICKMAARDTGVGAVEYLLHQGKLLALDLLVKVFENPLHTWQNVRPQFCDQLRQYLWPALLRNSLSPYREAFTAVTHLLSAILVQPRLRAGLKVEIGAFYPLIILRPLEADKPNQAQQLAALEAVKNLAGNAQLMTDLFLNYDCNLQASNLYERTLKCLAKVLQSNSSSGQYYSSTSGKIRGLALDTLLLLLQALDERASPLKAAAQSSSFSEDKESAHQDAATKLVSQQQATSSEGSHTNDVASEIARFGAIKEKKHSLESGIEIFNRDAVKGVRALIGSGTISDSPQQIADFLRGHRSFLSAVQLGEYFGHHEPQAVSAMHAYIDQESYSGLTIDSALRELLKNFRLPGEAQKIDRIMEKFAEKFCKDNDGVFASADGPYLLAFAIIMLNTDVHNPKAERKMQSDDFVNMCQTQASNGAFDPILPPDELQAIYKRVSEEGLPVAQNKDHSQDLAGFAPRKEVQTSKLAAALGLSHIFRSKNWDKQQGADAERANLLESARQIVARGQQAEHVWHSATYIEHVTPMLQVSANALRKGLSVALDSAADSESARPILDGFMTSTLLAGALGLDHLACSFLEALASASGVDQPSDEGTISEAKQLLALQTLVFIASRDDAGFLGSAWMTILRTFSKLDLLREKLIHNGQKGNFFNTPPGQVEAQFTGNPHPFSSVSTVSRQPSNAKGWLSRFGFGSDNTATANGKAQEAKSGAEDKQNGNSSSSDESLFHGPSAMLVNWAEKEGKAEIQKVFTRSADLNGDAVIIFVRALCAISQEELVPENPSDPPRMYSLGLLVDCAYHNLNRIRLIWSRLWGAVAPHLVSAACHSDSNVASLAVNHMQRLIANLLARAESTHFTYQEDALRPLVSVLRHSSSRDVKEQILALISHSILAYPHGLGSGWNSILAALQVAAADPKPSIVDRALDSIQSVISSLFKGVGLEKEAVLNILSVLEVAMRNSNDEDLSIKACELVPSVADKLLDPRTELSEEDIAEDGHSSHATLQELKAEWTTLFGVLALVARHDPRKRVADAASNSLLNIVKTRSSSSWNQDLWFMFWEHGVQYALDLPSYSGSFKSDNRPASWSIEGYTRLQRHAFLLLPGTIKTVQNSFKSGCCIFPKVLLILMQYITSRQNTTATTGIQLLQACLVTLQGDLDSEEWQLVLANLNLACTTDLNLHIFRDSESSGDEGKEETAESLHESKVQCASQSLVLVQRLCCFILDHCADNLQPAIELQILSILQEAVQAAQKFNSSPSRRLTAGQSLHQDLGKSRRGGRRQSIQESEIQAEPSATDGHAMETERRQQSNLAIALCRQEAEGGQALIAALMQRCPKGASPLSDRNASEEVQKRLLGVSREFLQASAGRDSFQPEASENYFSPDRLEWNQVVRGPLVETILDCYRTVEHDVWLSELPLVWPYLVGMISSAQPSVREALSLLLSEQLQPMLKKNWSVK